MSVYMSCVPAFVSCKYVHKHKCAEYASISELSEGSAG